MNTYFINSFVLHFFLKCAFIVVLFFGALTVDAATLSVSPATGVYTAGQTFTAKVLVNTNGASVNAADGTLSYNPKEISVVSVSKGSIFNLWTADPAFSNANGTITFSGGSPTGYTGSNGAVISITFRATSAGSPKVSFTKGSVLAADGKGTNVLTTMNGGAFTISANEVVPEPEKIIEYVAPANTPGAPVVQSTTHSDTSKWYTAKTAELSWEYKSDVIAVRTLLNDSSSAIPTKVYDSPIKNITLTDLQEGVQYFHIQFKNADGWGKVTHYKLSVDSQKPSQFDIALEDGADLSNPEQKLKVTVADATSKVKRYLISLDGKEPYEYIDEQESKIITLTQLLPGNHTVVVEAFDEAGNSIVGTLSFNILSFDKPTFTEYPQEINEQVIPVIKGQTRPNSKVKVTIAQIGLGVSSADAVKTYDITSSPSGEFVFIPDGRLGLGVYELSAVAIDQYGAQSAVSDSIRIAVQQPGYLKIGAFVVSFLSVVIPLLALLVVTSLGVWFLLFRFRLLKKGVGRETKEAIAILASEFKKIEDELMHQKSELEDSRKTKKLTKAEADLFESLAKLLSDGQKRVQKEITDVEDLVD